MNKLLKILFPVQLQLTMLQLEEYKTSRFLIWIIKNLFTRKAETKKPLKVTNKIKIILFLSCTWLLIAYWVFFTITNNSFVSVFGALILLTQPYILFAVSVISLKPYEYVNRYLVINKVKQKVESFTNLKVIAVTGSYGKTTTKEFLYQIIRTKYKVLRTPESFNTIFGIAKVVDYELDSYYDFFICEMAAYKRGEIKTLTQMVPPHFGLLTGIAPQHLERFGSLQNIVQAKFELYDSINDPKRCIFNVDNKEVVGEMSRRGIKSHYTYSLFDKSSYVHTSSLEFTKKGSKLTLVIDKKPFSLTLPLFGFGNIQNLLGAVCMSSLIGMKDIDIISSLSSIHPIANRFELEEYGKTTVVNNTFSSNTQSFNEMIQTAKSVNGKKALVTPGIVELGSKSAQIHADLGKLARDTFDEIVLVGENSRTKAFSDTAGENVHFIKDTRHAYFSTISRLKGKYDWIFLENDITQNY